MTTGFKKIDDNEIKTKSASRSDRLVLWKCGLTGIDDAPFIWAACKHRTASATCTSEGSRTALGVSQLYVRISKSEIHDTPEARTQV